MEDTFPFDDSMEYKIKQDIYYPELYNGGGGIIHLVVKHTFTKLIYLFGANL